MKNGIEFYQALIWAKLRQYPENQRTQSLIVQIVEEIGSELILNMETSYVQKEREAINNFFSQLNQLRSK